MSQGERITKNRRALKMRYYKSHGIIFLIPILIIIVLFYGMIVWDIFAAFTHWQGLLPTWQFNGFKNFSRLFQMKRFWINLRNNILWLAIFIVPTVIVGFSLAYLITNLKRGETILPIKIERIYWLCGTGGRRFWICPLIQ